MMPSILLWGDIRVFVLVPCTTSFACFHPGESVRGWKGLCVGGRDVDIDLWCKKNGLVLKRYRTALNNGRVEYIYILYYVCIYIYNWHPILFMNIYIYRFDVLYFISVWGCLCFQSFVQSLFFPGSSLLGRRRSAHTAVPGKVVCLCTIGATNPRVGPHRIHGTGIFTYIYLICIYKSQLDVGKYTSPMDPMGILSPW